MSIQDFASMQTEYVEAYDELFKHAYQRLERLHSLKLHAIEFCENYLKKMDIDLFEELNLQRLTGPDGIRDFKAPNHFAEMKFTPVDLREVDDVDFQLVDPEFEFSDPEEEDESSSSMESIEIDSDEDASFNPKKSPRIEVKGLDQTVKNNNDPKKDPKKKWISIFTRDHRFVRKKFKDLEV